MKNNISHPNKFSFKCGTEKRVHKNVFRNCSGYTQVLKTVCLMIYLQGAEKVPNHKKKNNCKAFLQ